MDLEKYKNSETLDRLVSILVAIEEIKEKALSFQTPECCVEGETACQEAIDNFENIIKSFLDGSPKKVRFAEWLIRVPRYYNSSLEIYKCAFLQKGSFLQNDFTFFRAFSRTINDPSEINLPRLKELFVLLEFTRMNPELIVIPNYRHSIKIIIDIEIKSDFYN